MSNPNYRKIISNYFNHNLIQGVFRDLDDFREELVSKWKNIAEIYSPVGGEINRANYILRTFKDLGISNAYIDTTGNVVGSITGSEDGPCLLFTGTMDDLISIANRVKESKNPIKEEYDKLVGPGTFITGSCASIIGLARVLTHPDIKIKGKIYLVTVVKEHENLEGIRGFLKEHKEEIDYYIDVMGGVGRMYYGSLGISMFKVHFKGTRGHTLTGGLPNVTRGVAKAIDKIYSILLPSETKEKKVADFGIGKIDLSGHYLNIAMLGASDAMNHKAEDGWFSVDLRSISNDVIESTKSQIKTIVEEIANNESLGWWIETVGEIPGGQLPEARNSRLVKIAEEVMKLFRNEIYISNMGSTNMNIGILEQIPSIMIAGKEGGNRDTPEEYGNINYIMKGIKANFLIGFILASETLKT